MAWQLIPGSAESIDEKTPFMGIMETEDGVTPTRTLFVTVGLDAWKEQYPAETTVMEMREKEMEDLEGSTILTERPV